MLMHCQQNYITGCLSFCIETMKLSGLMKQPLKKNSCLYLPLIPARRCKCIGFQQSSIPGAMIPLTAFSLLLLKRLNLDSNVSLQCPEKTEFCFHLKI